MKICFKKESWQYPLGTVNNFVSAADLSGLPAPANGNTQKAISRSGLAASACWRIQPSIGLVELGPPLAMNQLDGGRRYLEVEIISPRLDELIEAMESSSLLDSSRSPDFH